MLPHVLEDVYQSLKRKEAQDNLISLYSANQAHNGTKESIKKFSDLLSVWLPGEKEQGKLAKYRAFIQGKNLKKGRK